MKKQLRFICIVCIFALLFSLNSFAANDSESRTDNIFVKYEFGNSNKTYITVDCDDIENQTIEGYTPPTFTTNNEENRVVFGDDERIKVTDYSQTPYTAICFIETKWPNGGSTLGTGWMFNEYCLMTAGHCVYDPAYGGAAVSMKVYPGKNGYNNPYGVINASGFSINSWWESNQLTSFDYAVVTLNTNIGLQCGYFGYTFENIQIGDTITVTGYPGDLFHSYADVYQWTMSGRLNAVTGKRLSYLIDTSGGQSGSPVYKAGNIAIGIHTGASLIDNHATKIDRNLFQLMQSY